MAEPGAARATGAQRILILGLPNSGKSRLFNGLTGGYDIVSNYPQTTVEVTERRCTEEGECWEVLDTPGLHGLYIQSEEELVVRERLYTSAPDIVVQCVDTHRFKESLSLTMDLLGLGLPLVIVLTAVGESARQGFHVDAAALSRELGVPVVVSPAPGAGLAELRRVLLSPPPAPQPPEWGGALDSAVASVSAALPAGCSYPGASALLLLENDPTFIDSLAAAAGGAMPAALTEGLARARAALAGKAPLMVSEQRNRWVDGVADRVARRAARGTAANKPRFAETFARMCRHPILGLPILAFFLGVIYVLVVYVAGALSTLLTKLVTDPVTSLTARLVPPGLWRDLLVGTHGLLTLGLFNSLTTVLPILSVFFLVFGVLEDIGYLPNLALLTRRAAGKLGISGNAVIPLVLGLGCKTMATMTARAIPSRREKLIVIALVAFAIPCSAQSGLSVAILGQHGVWFFVAAFSFLAVAEIAAGLVLNRFLPKEDQGALIMELPPIRLPRMSAVARKTGFRLLWFLREAIPIFLAAALAMFLLEKLGILTVLKRVLAPFITGWLGLPVDMVDALLLTFARSEAAAGYILKMSREGALNGLQSVVAVVLITTFAQCFANIAAMYREVGAKAATAVVAVIYILSFAYTGAVHEILVLAGRVLGT
jgi:ferrous iron transport protein B